MASADFCGKVRRSAREDESESPDNLDQRSVVSDIRKRRSDAQARFMDNALVPLSTDRDQMTSRKWRSAAGISMHTKRLEPHELDKVATATLAYYEQRAEDFRAGTRDHDVSQNIAALLRHIDGESPFVILDFGLWPGATSNPCGIGHAVIGLEGAVAFAAHGACRHRVRVWQQDFHRLDLR